jgi:hypothetical protein
MILAFLNDATLGAVRFMPPAVLRTLKLAQSITDAGAAGGGRSLGQRRLSVNGMILAQNLAPTRDKPTYRAWWN